MICKKCGKDVVCLIHGDNDKIDEGYQDMDDSYYYFCGKCVEGGATVCSIFHWCGETLFPEFTKSVVAN